LRTIACSAPSEDTPTTPPAELAESTGLPSKYSLFRKSNAFFNTPEIEE